MERRAEVRPRRREEVQPQPLAGVALLPWGKVQRRVGKSDIRAL